MERKILLLGILRQQEMHGYQLFETIEEQLALCTDISKPTAYYLLNKMAQDGWVIEEQTQDGNRPPRKVYRLTEAGEAAFQQLLRESLATYPSPNFPGDIGLAFLDLLPRAEALPLLQSRRMALQAIQQTVLQAPTHPGRLQRVIHRQARFLTDELVWLDQIIEELSQPI
ncbi:MAG: PadR family transcriptional regulator [Anaerolineales bacterium]|jgi:DNA-binding PadR family transcriptional regulator|nr:PadR family transcriptional regulator [Anaerolineales bacterium]